MGQADAASLKGVFFMDAVAYLKARERMCEGRLTCDGCVLCNEEESQCKDMTGQIEEAVESVEKWAAEHPEKTRQSEFLKLFPGTRKYKDGTLSIAPCTVDQSYRNSHGRCARPNVDCNDCCRQFWLKEVE